MERPCAQVCLGYVLAIEPPDPGIVCAGFRAATESSRERSLCAMAGNSRKTGVAAVFGIAHRCGLVASFALNADTRKAAGHFLQRDNVFTAGAPGCNAGNPCSQSATTASAYLGPRPHGSDLGRRGRRVAA